MSHLSKSQMTTPTPVQTPKGAHYSSALSAALLHGGWADGQAGKDFKGYEISWGELVRKWGKHTGGNTALLHHLRDISLLYLSAHSTTQTSASGYITISNTSASLGQSARSPAAHGAADATHSSNSSADAGESSQSGSGSSFIHVPHPHLKRSKSKTSFEAPRVSTSASRPSVGGSTLRQSEKAAYLKAADLDGDQDNGDDYWAEGNRWWNGVGMDQVDEVREGIRDLEQGTKEGKYSGGEMQSAILSLAYHYHAIGEHQAALKAYEEVDWDESSVGVIAGDAAALDRIRGRCLQGMSCEILDSTTSAALQAYLSIIPLLSTIIPPPSPTYLSNSTVPPTTRIPFETHRELHRWISSALCRASILSSRQQSSLDQTLRILRTYHAYSASWPASFRPNQRHRMLLLYLSALATGLPDTRSPAPSPYLLVGGETTLSARSVWRKEAIVAIRQGQRLLEQTTTFPRAGAVNRPVRSFTNLCVALADRSPELAPTVIEALWWSMSLTFQSQSTLRHLARLLQREDQLEDAKRIVELYVQLVLKARETAEPEQSLHLEEVPLKRLSTIDRDDVATTSEMGDEAQGLDGEVEAEADGDEAFIQGLLVGVQIVSLDNLEEAWRYACLAKDVVHAAKDIGSSKKAKVEEVLGIVRMAMATTGTDHDTRPKYQSEAINHLLTANKVEPSSADILYHLSYAQAEARLVDDAILSVRTALEIDSGNVQSWHLLALLLTAKGDWEGARKACDTGVSVWEADESADDIVEDEEIAAPALDAGVESHDFAASPSRSMTAMSSSMSVSPAPSLLRPSGSLTSLPLPTKMKTPRTRRLQNVIRLQMTLNVIIEKVDGAAAAMICQQDLFAFFSARSGEGRRQFGYSAGVVGSSMRSIAGLGGSYISVLGMGSPEADVNVHPPTPASPTDRTVESPPQITHSTASSTHGYSTPEAAGTDDDNAVETVTGEFDEKSSIKEKSEGRRSLSLGLAKHLHVPGIGKGSPGKRPRQMSGASGLSSRNRTASNSSAALSIASTANHSFYRNAGPTTESIRTATPPITENLPRTAGESRLLSNLWLMSAATFRRWRKMEQCLAAINEAELLDPENGDVWIQLGLYHSASNPQNIEAAVAAFTKAILLRPRQPSGLIRLSKLYIQTGQVELAHSFLNQVTQDNGWDLPEAWVLLARACKAQGRIARERECLEYALALEKSRTVRGLRDAVDRWL